MDQTQNHINYQQDILQEDEGPNIKKYIIKIINNWYWFVISIFLSLSTSYYITRYADPIYTVSTSIIVSGEANSGGGIESVLQEYMGKNRKRKAIVENEISILKSYTLAKMAIEQLPDFKISYIGHGPIRERILYKSTPFYIEIDTSLPQIYNYPVFISFIDQEKYRLEINDKFNIDTVLYFNQNYNSNIFNFKIIKKDSIIKFGYIKYSFRINNINRLINFYKNKLQIDVNGEKGSVLTLSMSGTVPMQISEYLNKISEIYILYGLEAKNRASELSIKFINEQLFDIKNDVKNAERNLQKFRVENHIFNLSNEGQLLFSKLDKYESEKSGILIKNKYLDYLQNYLNNNNNSDEIIAPSLLSIEDMMLNNLVSNYNDLVTKKNILKYYTSGDIPGLNLIEIQLEDIKSSLNERVKNTFETTQIRSQNIENQIIYLETEINKLPLNESQLMAFEREFNINNSIYNYLLEKKAEAGITKASNIPDNKILDSALNNNAARIAPNTKKNYFFGGLLGLLIPLLIIVLFDYFNNRIIEKHEIEKKTKVPIIGSIGHNDIDSEIPVFENPRSHLAEAFRSLRTNLKYITPGIKPKVICITSTMSGEGKSFSAINLATIVAMSNKKTLLMSLDLRKPKIHQIFNIKNDLGISTYLIGENRYKDIIFSTSINDLYVATSGPIPPNPAELLDTEKIDEFILKAKDEFDYIIIDTPPLALVTDALLIERFSDLTIFVIRQNYSQKQVLDLVNDLHHSKKMKNLSILVNDISTPGYYGYHYSYGGYGYGGYSRYGYTNKNGEGYYGEKIEKPRWLKNIFRKLFYISFFSINF